MQGSIRRTSTIVLIIVSLLGSLTQPVFGAMIATRDLLPQTDSQRDISPEEASALRQTVAGLLQEYGVAADLAWQRAARLSHGELQLLQEELNELPAGQSALAVVGALFLVLLILEILGVTNVFTQL